MTSGRPPRRVGRDRGPDVRSDPATGLATPSQARPLACARGRRLPRCHARKLEERTKAQRQATRTRLPGQAPAPDAARWPYPWSSRVDARGSRLLLPGVAPRAPRRRRCPRDISVGTGGTGLADPDRRPAHLHRPGRAPPPGPAHRRRLHRHARPPDRSRAGRTPARPPRPRRHRRRRPRLLLPRPVPDQAWRDGPWRRKDRGQHRPRARLDQLAGALIGTFAGFAMAAVYGGVLMATHRATRTSQLPLGPFILLGALVAVVI